MKMRYFYGMKFRGASPGAQPKGMLSCREDVSGKYYDIIEYDRKLTDKEIRDYELEFICMKGE